MVLLAVVNGEGEEVLEVADVVSNEHTVIRLANDCDIEVREKRDAKTRVLSCVELFIGLNSILISRGNSSLLDSLLIKNWSQVMVIPFTEGLPELESVVKERGQIDAKKMEPTAQGATTTLSAPKTSNTVNLLPLMEP